MQLNLLTSKRTPVLHAFPLHRRADMVRKIAAALDARSYQSGQRYWSLHVGQERAKLARLGLTTQQIDAEISLYATAISLYATAISHILHLQKQYGSAPDSAA